jgi:sigma-E factor negative regulatory protein RseB
MSSKLAAGAVPHRLTCAIFLVFLGLSPASYIQAEPVGELSSASTVLAGVDSANRQLCYRGIVSYEYGGVLRTMRLVHVARDGRVHESMQHLSGPSRQYLRRPMPACNKSNSNEAVARVGGGFRHPTIDLYYRLVERGDNRVADRPVRMIHLVPKDKYRYGQVVAVDKQTGLFLRTLTVDTSKQVLERFQFIDIEIDAGLTLSDAAPNASDFQEIAVADAPCQQGSPRDIVGKTVSPPPQLWVPPGFVEVARHAAEDFARNEWIFSDGLAVFSVFVDNGHWFNTPPLEAHRGASVIYMAPSAVEQHYTVSVVGEVPLATARAVVESVFSTPNAGFAGE